MPSQRKTTVERPFLGLTGVLPLLACSKGTNMPPAKSALDRCSLFTLV